MQNVVAGLFIAVIAFLGYVAASNFARQRRQQLYLSRLPKLEADGIDPQTTDLSQAKILIKKAFEEHLQHGVPVRMENPFEPARPLLVLPLKYLEEVKTVPEDIISLHSFSREMFLLNISSGPQFTPQCAHVARTDLYRNLPSILPLLQAACSSKLDELVGKPAEWKTMPIYDVFGQVIARLAATALTGVELATNDEWARIIMNVQFASIMAGMSIRQNYRSPFFRLAKLWDPLCRSLAADRKKSELLLSEAVSQRRKNGQASKDCLGWLVDAFPKRKLPDLVEDELFLAVAAVQTSMNALTNILCDLIERPQVMKDLRAEIDLVSAGRPGNLTFAEVMRLQKLDSFMKESQRLTPFSLINIGRSVRQRVTFDDGFTLEPGTQVVFPAYYAHTDPKRYPDPDTFQPYRFLNSNKEGCESFVTVNTGFLNFGIGQHACPGRHYAALQIKTILIDLLRNYDMRFVPEAGRPELLARNMSIVPDPQAKIQMRRL